jgi:prepilin-type N-terminal cleavage/methylation domain-containing protein
MKQSGATLMELMVVLAISAILLTIGIPAFASLSQSSRLSSATTELIASLHLARSEAIKRVRARCCVLLRMARPIALERRLASGLADVPRCQQQCGTRRWRNRDSGQAGPA